MNHNLIKENKIMNRKLEGKIALITGGSRGIGAAIAKRLATDGAKVAITYSKGADAAAAVVKEIERDGGKAIAIQADATDAEAAKAAVEKTVAAFGKLDVLVNNAGTAIPKTFEETTLEEIDRVLDINVRGVLVATQAALKHMKSGGSHHHDRLLLGERVMTPGLVPYSATKGAVKIFAQALSQRTREPGDYGQQRSAGSDRYGVESRRRASGQRHRRPPLHSAATGTLMKSLRWSRLSPVRNLRTSPGRILPWMAERMPRSHLIDRGRPRGCPTFWFAQGATRKHIRSDLRLRSNAVQAKRRRHPKGQEHFGPSGGVARSLQTTAGMLVARALPSAPNCSWTANSYL